MEGERGQAGIRVAAQTALLSCWLKVVHYSPYVSC